MNAVSRHCNTSTVLSAQVLEQAMALQAEALQEAQAARIAAEMLQVSHWTAAGVLSVVAASHHTSHALATDYGHPYVAVTWISASNRLRLHCFCDSLHNEVYMK